MVVEPLNISTTIPSSQTQADITFVCQEDVTYITISVFAVSVIGLSQPAVLNKTISMLDNGKTSCTYITLLVVWYRYHH